MIISGFKENDTFNSDDAFPVSILNIFIDYPLDQMQTTNMNWKHWNTAPLRLWQTQLNFMVYCALSGCGVSSKHLNYEKHSMVRLLYRFYMYYYMKRVFKRPQVLLPHKAGFNPSDNPYSNREFFKLCEDYNIPHDSMRYQDEKFYWTYH